MVADLLGILHPFSEDRIPGTRVVLQVGLVTIEDILWRNPFSSFLVMVEEPVDLLMGQSRPTALDEVGLPHIEILVASNESSDKVHTRQVVGNLVSKE